MCSAIHTVTDSDIGAPAPDGGEAVLHTDTDTARYVATPTACYPLSLKQYTPCYMCVGFITP